MKDLTNPSSLKKKIIIIGPLRINTRWGNSCQERLRCHSFFSFFYHTSCTFQLCILKELWVWRRQEEGCCHEGRGGGGQELSARDYPLYSSVGRGTAPPAVCLSWPVCGCVAGLQPSLFSDVFPWSDVHLPWLCVALIPGMSACCKTKPCADLSPKDPAHSLFSYSSSGVQHHPKPTSTQTISFDFLTV